MQFQQNDKNVLPSLRQGGGLQRICSRQKSIRNGTARDSFSQPPHMRGKGLLTILTYMYFRVTPAYAGKSAEATLCAEQGHGHPRVCGEKCALVWLARFRPGSPPRMRGKVLTIPKLTTRSWDHPRVCGGKGVKQRYLRVAVGITPAYAGKRSASAAAPAGQRDHPRVCGEKMHMLLCVPASYGSPPRMRGKARRGSGYKWKNRITPAHAGKRFLPLHP